MKNIHTYIHTYLRTNKYAIKWPYVFWESLGHVHIFLVKGLCEATKNKVDKK